MSKEIKITIIMDDGKLNIESEEENAGNMIVTHDLSVTVMSTLLKNNLVNGSFCGGRGDCGRCRIQFLSGATMPTALERSVMEPEELRQGYRLACMAKPKDDCVIKFALLDPHEINIVADMTFVTQKNDHISQQKGQTENSKVGVMEFVNGREGIQRLAGGGELEDVLNNRSINLGVGDFLQAKEPGDGTEAMIAVDLGTTTIAMQLMEIQTGQVIDTYCEMNPQRRYGADVLSRIQASCAGNREILQYIVTEVLERGVSRFKRLCSGRGTVIRCMCIAGNTTMGHLFMGYDVTSLGNSPFTPVEIGLQEYRHPAWDFKVWLTPGISAFVGGDIVAGLYALHMLPDTCRESQPIPCENPQEKGTGMAEQAVLLIDLGTNGEMAITDGARMVVTATAAGPAFEGGAGAGVVGSDMVACVAGLLQRGALDETGLLAEPYFTEGISVGEPAVRLVNKDIRDLQMAKAAVRAGMEILWEEMGRPGIRQVYLAGGFGYYLDVAAAFRIGLLPEYTRGKVTAVGNTSLAGAYHIGCDLWRGKTDGDMLEWQVAPIESINLAKREEFGKLYVRYMDFRE